MKRLLLAAMMPALLVACSEDKKPQSGENSPQRNFFWQISDHSITIQSVDGQALAGAKVLFGSALDNPFAGNFQTADQNGQVEIPDGWRGPLDITIEAPGFLRATYLNQSPESLTYNLRPLPMATQYEVTGLAKQLPVEDKDGFIDFGLVMSAFSKSDLLSFDINDIISAQTDRISVMGQNLEVPSNISLPKQTEKYSFFSVTLEKPVYRIYYGQPGVNRVFAARGRFPFKKVVDEMRGGAEFYNLINDFKINGGVIRDIDVRSGQMKLDLPTRELDFKNKNDVTAPQFKSDEIFMAVGIANQSGYMIPTDVKRLDKGKTLAINTLTGADSMVLGVLTRKQEMKEGTDRMSATLVPITANTSPTMLPLIDNPTISGNDLVLPKISPISGVYPIATYTVLSKEEEVLQGRSKVKLMIPQWEVYAQDWQERVTLPQWPEAKEISGVKRWEVNLIGSQTTSQVQPGPAMIEAATHVTHSSVSF